MDKINMSDKFALFADYWNPRIVGALNGQQIKLVKILGEFVWHHHDAEDELFFVVKGKLVMDFKDRREVLNPGEMIIVPRGVEHKPSADEETQVLLFEPASTLNTGNTLNERTRATLESL